MFYDTVGPQSFSDIFERHSLTCPANETVRLLTPEMPAQLQMIKTLSGLKQTRFINLVKEQNDALISMALYAGDGVVTKITPDSYIARDDLPFVLFPFAAKRFEGTFQSGDFFIENYPCVAISQSEDDVKIMKRMLASCGLVFAEQDDRPRNIGILQDGSLAVIDSNAVKIQAHDKLLIARQAKEWRDKVTGLYPELYAPGYTYQQSSQTDFTIRSYRSVPAEPQIEERPVFSRPFWKRALRFTENAMA